MPAPPLAGSGMRDALVIGRSCERKVCPDDAWRRSRANHHRRRPALGRIDPPEQLAPDVLAEGAVALPLRLVEELIDGGLLGKGPMLLAVLEHVERLVPRQR